jgi:uncharacterized protein
MLGDTLATWQSEHTVPAAQKAATEAPAAKKEPEPAKEQPATASADQRRQPRPVATRRTKSVDNELMVKAGGLGFAVLLATSVRLFLRYRRRRCPDCNATMWRLAEETEDRHLSDEQQKEEALGSVVYDVWMCPDCEKPLVTKWYAILTRLRSCPRCSVRALRTTSHTIRRATTSSSGRIEILRDCQHCSFHDRETRTIPRKRRWVRRSSSSGSSWSSGGSSSGGSSSGRGSSGSW